jgi:hypothetical protein
LSLTSGVLTAEAPKRFTRRDKTDREEQSQRPMRREERRGGGYNPNAGSSSLRLSFDIVSIRIVLKESRDKEGERREEKGK